jgi:tetratricopeptide (TPR) repeat protein
MRLPEELIQALRQRRAVLVAGAGCETLRGWPGWPVLVEVLTEAVPDDLRPTVAALAAKKDWAGALGWLRGQLAASVVELAIHELAPTDEPVPAALVALAAGPWRAIVTTGYHDTWQRALEAAGRPPVASEGATPAGPLLVHLLGRASAPDSLCLGPDDLRARVIEPGLAARVAEMASDGPLVFVGFEPGDPDLPWAVSSLTAGEEARTPRHHVLTTAPSRTGLPDAAQNLAPIAGGEGGLDVVLGAFARAVGAVDEMEAPPPEPTPPAAPLPSSDDERRAELHAELDRQTEEQRWAEAVVTLGRLAALEIDPALHARYHHAAALIQRDRLANPRAALALLERATRDAPELTAAWEAAAKLLRERGDLAALRSHLGRRLLHAPPPAEPAHRARLWRELGELSWRPLRDHDTAAAALEAAAALDPTDASIDETLAELYDELGAAAARAAIAAHQRRAARRPEAPAPYQALERLWEKAGRPERARWAANARAVLGSDHASPPPAPTDASALTGRGTLSDRTWDCLAHPDEDGFVGAAFALVGPALETLTAPAAPVTPDQPGEPVPFDRGPAPAEPPGAFAARAAVALARALGQPPPALHLGARPGAPIEVHRLPGEGPLALLIDRTFACHAAEEEIVFRLARTLALLRPRWRLRFVLPTPALLGLGLRVALAAGGAPPRDVDPEAERVARQVKKRLSTPAREQLAAITHTLAARPAPVDLDVWAAASELTAARAALALGGDLAAAVRVVDAEGDHGALTARERRRDLLAFAVSEELFAVRAALGLTA